MIIKILLFGVLAEKAKAKEFTLSDIYTLRELKEEILKRHPVFSGLKFYLFLNHEEPVGDPVLKSGDEIALIPPFAGG